MANMSKIKVPMPEQDPQVRNKQFQEVALGYGGGGSHKMLELQA